MTNPNDPANPCHSMANGELLVDLNRRGLTKLEYFAGLAMQGILSKRNPGTENTSYGEIASDAVMCAKILIEQLNKKNQ